MVRAVFSALATGLKWLAAAIFLGVVALLAIGMFGAMNGAFESDCPPGEIISQPPEQNWGTCASPAQATQDVRAVEAKYQSLAEDMKAQEDWERDQVLAATYIAADDNRRAADSAAQDAEQAACDPNYGGCVPGDRDYDCPELHAMGIGDIPVIGQDWQRLDGNYDYQGDYWVSPPDGVGCEWAGE